MADPIVSVTPTIKWRDVLHLQIKDPELKKHVEGFLDKLESSGFTYKFMDAQTQQISERTLSGQDILARIKGLTEAYKGAGAFDQLRPILARPPLNMEMVDGKITIADKAGPYRTAADGSITLFADPNGSLPMGIQLGQEYLKGAKYLGVDGKYHPATVDGVLANELAHVAFRTRDDVLSNQVEGIITTTMGAVQRDPNSRRIQYSPNGNGGYQTLYDKQPTRGGELKISPDIKRADITLDKSFDTAMSNEATRDGVSPSQLASAVEAVKGTVRT